MAHDGLYSHAKLIERLGRREEIYKSAVKDNEYPEAMAMASNLSSWVKRYLGRSIGMKARYFQEYLNWYVYLFRVKKADYKRPSVARVIRHLLLSESAYTSRKSRKLP